MSFHSVSGPRGHISLTQVTEQMKTGTVDSSVAAHPVFIPLFCITVKCITGGLLSL